MKLLRLGSFALVCLLSTFATAATDTPPRIFMIGDSTMANKGTAIPEWGWGMALPKFCADPAMVRNHAKNGRSSKSFVDEGLWREVHDQLQPGDWVIIQFSHNDEKNAPALHTDPATTFRDYLRNYIAESRARGANPILATPVVRRRFDEAGSLVDTHGDYPDAIRAVAQEQQVPLLELQHATASLLLSAGPEGSKKFFMWLEPGVYPNRPKGAKDDTHFVELGATRVAELAVQQIRELNLPLAKWLTGATPNTAWLPRQRNAEWTARHEGFAARARAGGFNVLFIGDSITQLWGTTGLPVWEKYLAPLGAVNFGIGADRTQNFLWRLPRGELEGPPPKVIVLLIGTNNLGLERSGKIRNTTAEAIAGVLAVIDLVKEKRPESKLLLLGVFPRGAKDDPVRAQVAELNGVLRKLDDGHRIRFLDFGDQFLAADGSIPPELMPDLLHPSEHGYEIWANAMLPLLTEMLAQP